MEAYSQAKKDHCRHASNMGKTTTVCVNRKKVTSCTYGKVNQLRVIILSKRSTLAGVGTFGLDFRQYGTDGYEQPFIKHF